MKSKVWQLVLSIVIAFALWLYVISVVSPESDETFYDIPVSYQNDVLEERGLMIVSETPTVTLHLKGNRSDLNELNAGNITILVDLAAIQTPGTQLLRYTVSYPANLPSNAFETLSQTPNLLQLKVENKVKKTVPIQLDYMATSVPEGYIADKETPMMDTAVVEISGPESVVEQITKAMIQVDLTDQTKSVVGAYPYVLCNDLDEPVDAAMVTTNVEEVNLTVNVQRVKELPLVVNVVDGGGATKDTCKIELQRETSTIWVSGSESKLRDLNEIELGTINLAEFREETNTLTFDLVLPEGVNNMTGETQVTVILSFPDLGIKKLTINKAQFQAAGVPAGAEAVWISEMVDVELRGPKELVKNITENDVIITVDFTGEELGPISKLPQVTLGSDYSGVGALSVTAVTASLQNEVPDATEG